MAAAAGLLKHSGRRIDLASAFTHASDDEEGSGEGTADSGGVRREAKRERKKRPRSHAGFAANLGAPLQASRMRAKVMAATQKHRSRSPNQSRHGGGRNGRCAILMNLARAAARNPVNKRTNRTRRGKRSANGGGGAGGILILVSNRSGAHHSFAKSDTLHELPAPGVEQWQNNLVSARHKNLNMPRRPTEAFGVRRPGTPGQEAYIQGISTRSVDEDRRHLREGA
jgi:hypothetical protein